MSRLKCLNFPVHLPRLVLKRLHWMTRPLAILCLLVSIMASASPETEPKPARRATAAELATARKATTALVIWNTTDAQKARIAAFAARQKADLDALKQAKAKNPKLDLLVVARQRAGATVKNAQGQRANVPTMGLDLMRSIMATNLRVYPTVENQHALYKVLYDAAKARSPKVVKDLPTPAEAMRLSTERLAQIAS